MLPEDTRPPTSLDDQTIASLLAAWSEAATDEMAERVARTLVVVADRSPSDLLGRLAGQVPFDLLCAVALQLDRPQEVVPALLDMTADYSGDECDYLFRALPMLDMDSRTVVDSLVRAVGRHDIRPRALLALSRLGPAATNATPCLVELASDHSWHEQAVRTLLAIEPDAAVHLLDPYLRSTDAADRTRAAEWITDSRPVSLALVPVLSKMLTDPVDRIRVRAAEALWSLGEGARPALAELIRAAKDPHSGVRRGAFLALAELRAGTDRAISSFAAGLRDEENSFLAAQALIAANDAARSIVPMLIEGLRDESPLVRVNSAGVYWHLQRADDTIVLPILLDCLRYREWHAHLEAAQYLAQMGRRARDALPLLECALATADFEAERSILGRAIAAIRGEEPNGE